MERKVPFVEDEYYHLYTRGVEKRNVFTDPGEYERFMSLLFLCNGDQSVRMRSLSRKGKSDQGEPLAHVFKVENRPEPAVDILAYVLMPNHVHLLVREKKTGGISKFMLKLMTGYSMFFNTKHERSGPLFTRPFRSKHVDSDEYFHWVFAYILLNPLELFQRDWKESGIQNMTEAQKFMHEYRYSGFVDYFGKARPESAIVSPQSLPLEVQALQGLDELLDAFAHREPGNEHVFA